MKSRLGPITSVKAKRNSVAAAAINSAKPYLRGQLCSQYAEVAVVSLRSAELIANLSLHRVPGFRAVHRRESDSLCAIGTARRHILFRKEVGRYLTVLVPGGGQ